MSGRITTVIAEDNYLVREGTRRLLEDTGEIEILAAVGNAAELVNAVERLGPAAAITDIRMPPDHHMEGITAAHAIRAHHPSVGVVVLSQHADEAYAFELLKNGTAGLAYLLKDRVADTEAIVRALREVVGGGSVIDPAVVEMLVARRTRIHCSPLGRLTPRELDVLRQMAEGNTNQAIAEHLSLSLSSIEKNVNTIFVKLGLNESPHAHKRVTAVLTLLRDIGIHDASRP